MSAATASIATLCSKERVAELKKLTNTGVATEEEKEELAAHDVAVAAQKQASKAKGGANTPAGGGPKEVELAKLHGVVAANEKVLQKGAKDQLLVLVVMEQGALATEQGALDAILMQVQQGTGASGAAVKPIPRETSWNEVKSTVYDTPVINGCVYTIAFDRLDGAVTACKIYMRTDAKWTSIVFPPLGGKRSNNQVALN